MKTLTDLGGAAGFTLIEIVITVLIIGILSAIALPQYTRLVEKPRAQEGIDILRSIKGAQDRYFNKYGAYCIGALTQAACPGFDLVVPTPKYFVVVPNSVASGAAWSLTLTRNFATALYGAYTLTYDAAAATPLSCTPAPDCTNNLLPMIH